MHPPCLLGCPYNFFSNLERAGWNAAAVRTQVQGSWTRVLNGIYSSCSYGCSLGCTPRIFPNRLQALHNRWPLVPSSVSHARSAGSNWDLGVAALAQRTFPSSLVRPERLCYRFSSFFSFACLTVRAALERWCLSCLFQPESISCASPSLAATRSDCFFLGMGGSPRCLAGDGGRARQPVLLQPQNKGEHAPPPARHQVPAFGGGGARGWWRIFSFLGFCSGAQWWYQSKSSLRPLLRRIRGTVNSMWARLRDALRRTARFPSYFNLLA